MARVHKVKRRDPRVNGSLLLRATGKSGQNKTRPASSGFHYVAYEIFRGLSIAS